MAAMPDVDLQSFLIAAAAAVVAFTTLGGAFLWLVKPRIQQWVLSLVEPIGRKIDETHQMTTVNAHKSQTPTVLDRLDTMRRDQLAMAQGQTEMREAITEVSVALDDHLMTAARDSMTLQRHTAELSKIGRAMTTQAEADKALWPAIEAVAKATPADFLAADASENDEPDDEEAP